MVAIGDFGIEDRKQMVQLAIRLGWVHDAIERAKQRGWKDPVVVLVAIDALDLLPFRFDRTPRSRHMERLQRASGCKRFTVCTARYSDLLSANAAEGWQEDMEELRGKGGVSVVCINRTGQFLASITPLDSE
jgi:hypothetical protein